MPSKVGIDNGIDLRIGSYFKVMRVSEKMKEAARQRIGSSFQ